MVIVIIYLTVIVAIMMIPRYLQTKEGSHGSFLAGLNATARVMSSWVPSTELLRWQSADACPRLNGETNKFEMLENLQPHRVFEEV
jgi:hypothetical protein